MTPVDASESPDSTMPTSVHPAVPTSVHSVEGRGRGREAAICQAALELLAEVGYDRMSMDAVALRARAGKATIYRHWPGKYELVLDAVRSRAARARPGRHRHAPR